MQNVIKDFYTVKEVAEVSGKTQRHILRLCREGFFIGAQKEGDRWKIPYSALYEYICPVEAAAAAKEYKQVLAEFGEIRAAGAEHKLYIMNRFRTLVIEYRKQGYNLKDAQTLAVEQIKIGRGIEKPSLFSMRTLYHWKRDYRLKGLRGLISRK